MPFLICLKKKVNSAIFSMYNSSNIIIDVDFACCVLISKFIYDEIEINQAAIQLDIFSSP